MVHQYSNGLEIADNCKDISVTISLNIHHHHNIIIKYDSFHFLEITVSLRLGRLSGLL
jgi:hypothetical protein